MKRRWFCRVEWKPQDCWVGVFWKSRAWWNGEDGWEKTWCVGPCDRDDCGAPEGERHRHMTEQPNRRSFDAWVCILPMLPFHFGWETP